MKWKLILFMALLMIPLVSSIEGECKGIMLPSSQDIPCLVISTWQFPNSCNTYTIKVYRNATLLDQLTMEDLSQTGRCSIQFNYTQQGSYLLNWSSGDSSKIIVEGEDRMASLSVTLFIGAITVALFYMGIKHDFSKNHVANIIYKRCLIVLGLFLLSLDTTIIVTMADNAGLGVNRELFRYLWLINWTIYAFMVFLVFTTIVNVLKMSKDMIKNKRMGGGNELE